MFNLWKFLLLLVSPHVGDEDDLPPNDDDLPPNDDDLPPNDDDDLPPNDDDDLPPNDDDDIPPPKETRAQREIRTLRERAQVAEDARRKLEADLENARRQPSQPQQPTQDQLLWEQEEKVLRDPNADDRTVEQTVQPVGPDKAVQIHSCYFGVDIHALRMMLHHKMLQLSERRLAQFLFPVNLI